MLSSKWSTAGEEPDRNSSSKRRTGKNYHRKATDRTSHSQKPSNGPSATGTTGPEGHTQVSEHIATPPAPSSRHGHSPQAESTGGGNITAAGSSSRVLSVPVTNTLTGNATLKRLCLASLTASGGRDGGISVGFPTSSGHTLPSIENTQASNPQSCSVSGKSSTKRSLVDKSSKKGTPATSSSEKDASTSNPSKKQAADGSGRGLDPLCEEKCNELERTLTVFEKLNKEQSKEIKELKNSKEDLESRVRSLARMRDFDWSEDAQAAADRDSASNTKIKDLENAIAKLKHQLSTQSDRAIAAVKEAERATELKDKCRELEKEKQALEAQVRKLQTRTTPGEDHQTPDVAAQSLANLCKDLDKLRKELNDCYKHGKGLAKEKRDLEAAAALLQKELLEAQGNRDTAASKPEDGANVAKLREMIVHLKEQTVLFQDIAEASISSNSTRRDEEYEKIFVNLRMQVHGLVSHRIFAIRANTASDRITQDPRTELLHSIAISVASTVDVQNRLMAKVFHTLHSQVFDKPIFGMRDEEDTKLCEIERGLGAFETLMSACDRVDEKSLHCWKLLTLHCIKLTEMQEKYSKEILKKLIACLDPFANPPATDVERIWCVERMEEISATAVDLALQLRFSKAGYRVVQCNTDDWPQYSAAKKFTDFVAIEGGTPKSAPSSDIAYFRFGALTRDPNNSAGEEGRQVLVKAQAVLKRRH